jgi:lipoyl(octanoyl) transferase 2
MERNICSGEMGGKRKWPDDLTPNAWMSLPSSVLFHLFPLPVPYLPALRLQQSIHQWQLAQRRDNPDSHRDVILLLQHRPVYTAGRRQTDDELAPEMNRLSKMGADFVKTKRGGQTTYHGPGQLVVYPLLDLARAKMSVRDYVCFIQTSIKRRLLDAHGMHSIPSDNTGVFMDEFTKVASIGVQVQHRLTMHGLALNVTSEPKAWFNQVVACGLADVKAGSISDYSNRNEVSMEAEAEGMLRDMAGRLEREIEPALAPGGETVDPYLQTLLKEAEDEASNAGPWLSKPQLTRD